MAPGGRPKRRASRTHLARLSTDATTARRVMDAVAESLDPDETAAAAFAQADGRWAVEMHFAGQPERAAVRGLVALVAGRAAARALRFATLARRDWVRASLTGLKPVAAGRSIVPG